MFFEFYGKNEVIFKEIVKFLNVYYYFKNDKKKKLWVGIKTISVIMLLFINICD